MRKPSVVLGWPARIAASLAGMSERTVQAWRQKGFYTPQLRLPEDVPLGWAPYVELKQLYGAADCLALRAAHDIRKAGASASVSQVIAREIGALGNFGADRDGILLSIGKLAKDDLSVFVPVDQYVVKRWMEESERSGSHLSFFEPEQIKKCHRQVREDSGGQYERIPEDLIVFYAVSQAAQEVSQRIWTWKEQNVSSRRLLAPWLSPDIEQEIEESVLRSAALGVRS